MRSIPIGLFRRALASALVVGLANGAFGQETEGDGRILRILKASQEDDSERNEEVVNRLTRLGPNSIPAQFVTFVEVRQDPPEHEEPEGNRTVELSEEDRDRYADLLEEALLEMPEKKLYAFLAERTEPESSSNVLLAALRLLRAKRSNDALPIVLHCLEIGAANLRDRRVQNSAESVLRRTLSSDDRAWRSILGQLDELEDPMLPSILAAATRTERVEAMDVYRAVLGRTEVTDRMILEGVAELEDEIPWRLDDPEGLIRPYLQHDSWRLRKKAAEIAGEIQAIATVPELIRLLDDWDPRVSRVALRSLRELTRANMPTTSGEWLDWSELEYIWWEERGLELMQSLQEDGPDQAVKAIRELIGHPLFRDEIAELLLERFEQEDPAVQIVTCLAFEHLGIKSAVPLLAEAMRQADFELRQAAWQALRNLTGEDLSENADDWLELVQG